MYKYTCGFDSNILQIFSGNDSNQFFNNASVLLRNKRQRRNAPSFPLSINLSIDFKGRFESLSEGECERS